MYGLYITGRNKGNKADGVEKKIQSQIAAFEKKNIKMDILYENYKDYPFSRLLKYVPIFSKQLNISDIEKLGKYDFIYMRKPIIDFNLIILLKRIKKLSPTTTCIMEIPTYPYDKEFQVKFTQRYLGMKDKFWRQYLNKSLDYIVTYSNDAKIFDIPTIRVSNAADYENIKQKTSKFNTDNSITMTAIANFQSFHGYDRLIKGIAQYYSEGGDWAIRLNLIGNGNTTVLNSYKSMISNSNLEGIIKVLPGMDSRELDTVFDTTDLAVDTLARFRSGVYYNSTLKGKEYLARGIPIISGVETELDNFENYEYYFRVPADESSINISDILDFYTKVILQSNKTDKEVIQFIREFGKKNFNFDKMLEPVINKIKSKEKQTNLKE
ncbi:glycosyl transferase [Enterococcus faecium]|uniref:glycosyltransferase n=1 Tax=Enterococcus TaxID=1350 RepID=UPI000CF23AD7|nr:MULTISPECIES: glycosyltransferase [Enterococcus]EMF0165035.1 glycosyltransferase [Enterococcus hirae]PQG35447.1 glycosyl transferase [Enterococcus faecium]HAZ1089222.1 glycosyltransferase [Enterococcus faecium]